MSATTPEVSRSREAAVDEHAASDWDDFYDDTDDDGYEPNCQTCGGEGIEECEDVNSSEGCWAADCDGYHHTCPNCRGSGRAKDQWFW